MSSALLIKILAALSRLTGRVEIIEQSTYDVFQAAGDPDHTPFTLWTQIAALVAAGKREINVQPAEWHFSATAGFPAWAPVLAPTQHVAIRLGGSRLIQDWNGVDPDTLAIPITVRGGGTLEFYGIDFDYNHPIAAQGVLVAWTGANYDAALDPDKPILFVTVDDVVKVVPIPDTTNEVAFTRSEYEKDENGDSNPYAMVSLGTYDDNGWPIWRFSPPQITLAGLTVARLFPLTLTMAAGAFKGGEIVAVTASTPILDALLAGKRIGTRRDPDDATHLFLTFDDDRIDARSAAAEVAATLSLASEATPEWMTEAGTRLTWPVRKRAAGFAYIRGCRGVKFVDCRFRSIAAAGLIVVDGDDLYLDAEFRNDDRWVSCTAGPVQVYDFRRITGPGVDVTGSLDDPFNPRGRSWDYSIVPGSIDLAAGKLTCLFNTDFVRNPLPSPPERGDRIELTPIEVIGQVYRVVKLVEPTTNPAFIGQPGYLDVTFTESLPGDFAPATPAAFGWQVLNRSKIAEIKCQHHLVSGSATRGLVIQSHNWEYEYVRIKGTTGSPIRAIYPLGGGRDGGFRGGGHIGTLVCDYTNFGSGGQSADGTIAAIVRQLDGMAVAADPGWPPLIIDTLVTTRAGFAALVAIGVKLRVGQVYLTDIGVQRTLAGVLDGAAFYDLYTRFGEIVIGAINSDYAPTFFEGDGGDLTILAGSRLTTGPLAAIAGQRDIVMPKKVKPGHEGRIAIVNANRTIRVPADMLIADGTRTVTIDAAWPAMAAGEIYEGTHTRC